MIGPRKISECFAPQQNAKAVTILFLNVLHMDTLDISEEVYNKGFQHTLLLVTFQFIKRIPANFNIFTYTPKYLNDPHSY